MNRKARFILSVSLLIGLTLLDQWTKWLAVRHLKGQEDVPLIPGVLILHYLYPENRGMAFGLFSGARWLFVLIAVVFLVVIGVVLWQTPTKKRFIPLRAALVMIGAGALGNLLDRGVKGFVVDFIYFRPINFPVFNLADVCIVTGGILFVLLILFFYRGEEQADLLFRKGRKQK